MYQCWPPVSLENRGCKFPGGKHGIVRCHFYCRDGGALRTSELLQNQSFLDPFLKISLSLRGPLVCILSILLQMISYMAHSFSKCCKLTYIQVMGNLFLVQRAWPTISETKLVRDRKTVSFKNVYLHTQNHDHAVEE